MRESEPEKRRKPLIYIRLTNVQEHLYPHKGAFFRGSFFVAHPAQKEENRLYIIILQNFQHLPCTRYGQQVLVDPALLSIAHLSFFNRPFRGAGLYCPKTCPTSTT